MLVSICDKVGRCVAKVGVDRSGKVCHEGDLPDGLTTEDLESLGFVYYETDERGKSVPRVRGVKASESLDYLRALNDSLPPGYHLAEVQSDKIEHQRMLKRARFEAELQLME